MHLGRRLSAPVILIIAAVVSVTTSVPASGAVNRHVEIEAARAASPRPGALPVASDADVISCLERISIFRAEPRGVIFLTDAARDLSALEIEAYYRHPDEVGFGYVDDPDSSHTASRISWNIAMPSNRQVDVSTVIRELTAVAPDGRVAIRPVDRAGTVRQLCSVFLDAQSDPEIRVSLAYTAIDKIRNRVIVATWDGGRVSDYAKAKYGDLALVVPGGRVQEQDRMP